MFDWYALEVHAWVNTLLIVVTMFFVMLTRKPHHRRGDNPYEREWGE